MNEATSERMNVEIAKYLDNIVHECVRVYIEECTLPNADSSTEAAEQKSKREPE